MIAIRGRNLYAVGGVHATRITTAAAKGHCRGYRRLLRFHQVARRGPDRPSSGMSGNGVVLAQEATIIFHLIFKRRVGEPQFSGNNACAVPGTLQSCWHIPVQKTGPAFDQSLDGTYHFVSAHVLDFRPNRLRHRIRVFTSLNLRRMSTDLPRLDPISVKKDPKISRQRRALFHTSGICFRNLFIVSANRRPVGAARQVLSTVPQKRNDPFQNSFGHYAGCCQLPADNGYEP